MNSPDLTNVIFLPSVPRAARSCQCGEAFATTPHSHNVKSCGTCGRLCECQSSQGAHTLCVECADRPAIMEIPETVGGVDVWLPVCATCVRHNQVAIFKARPIHHEQHKLAKEL